MTTPASLQDVIEPDHVTHDIGIRISDAIAHPCLSSQVHHHLRLIRLKNPVNRLLIRDIPLDKLPAHLSPLTTHL